MLLLLLLPRQLLAAHKSPAMFSNHALLDSITRCTNLDCLVKHQRQVGSDEVASIVFYLQWLRITPSSSSAATGLLRRMPKTKETFDKFRIVSDGGKSPRGGQSGSDELRNLYESWPKSLDTSVTKFPKFLPAYIRFGFIASADPRLRYIEHEEKVCRNVHARFVAVFHNLTAREQGFENQLINPTTCKSRQ